MVVHEIHCRILDDIYEDEDFDIYSKIVLDHKQKNIFAWDGIEWNQHGFYREYENRNQQYDYDEFVERINKIIESKIIYEIANELEEDQSYFFDNERIYLYIEERRNIYPTVDKINKTL